MSALDSSRSCHAYLKQGTIIKDNESDLMQQTLQMALKLARLDTSKILILGETETGKSLLAKFILAVTPVIEIRKGDPSWIQKK